MEKSACKLACLCGQLERTDDEAELVLRIVFQIQFRNLGFRDTNLNVPCSTSLKGAGEVGRFVLSTLEKRPPTNHPAFQV